MIERFGHSLFCDDIRSEVGGKLSFIGCYNGVMFVPSRLPFLLPKFCVHIQIKSPPHRPFSSIVARCYVPGRPRPLLEETIAAPEVKEQARLISELEHQEAASRFIVAAASLIVSPLEIREPGLIRIRAVLDNGSEELQLGALRVVAADG